VATATPNAGKTGKELVMGKTTYEASEENMSKRMALLERFDRMRVKEPRLRFGMIRYGFEGCVFTQSHLRDRHFSVSDQKVEFIDSKLAELEAHIDSGKPLEEFYFPNATYTKGKPAFPAKMYKKLHQAKAEIKASSADTVKDNARRCVLADIDNIELVKLWLKILEG
jgi:hypothetical protein